MTTIQSPQHIAIIMDGNGRWAKLRKDQRIVGHHAGVKALKRIVEFAANTNIQALTVYAFSQENWQRPTTEIDFLMTLLESSLESEIKSLHDNHIKLCFIGDRVGLSSKLIQMIEKAEQMTASNQGLKLTIATNYSSHQDIVSACYKIVCAALDEKISLTDINEEFFAQYLSSAGLGEPDLLIRTGGEQRLSNYLLWELAYTELYFTNILWPDFSPEDMQQAIAWFAKRERRFGKTSEQVNVNSYA